MSSMASGMRAERHRPSALGPYARVARARSRSTYLAITSTSRFTGSPGRAVPEVRLLQCIRDERDCEGSRGRGAATVSEIAVHGDRALLHQVALEGRRDAPRPARPSSPSAAQLDDAPHAVHVALDDVAVEAAVGPHAAARGSRSAPGTQPLAKAVRRSVSSVSSQVKPSGVDRDRGEAAAVRRRRAAERQAGGDRSRARSRTDEHVAAARPRSRPSPSPRRCR